MKAKKLYCVFILLVDLIALFVSPLLFMKQTLSPLLSFQNPISTFPSSLQVVEEEAFAEASLYSLVFGDELLRVEARAFSSMSSSVEAQFPESIIYISDSTFEGTIIDRIYGISGTYAQVWAEEHNVIFEPTEFFYNTPPNTWRDIGALLSLVSFCCLPADNKGRRIKRYIKTTVISMRPQDRIELYPINYRFP